jgi:hypothetical protein
VPFPDRETRVFLWADDGIRRHRKSRCYSDLQTKGAIERSGALGTPEWLPVAPALANAAAIGSDIARRAILADTGPDGRHDSRECMLALVEAFCARTLEAGTARPSRSQRRRQATCGRDCRTISSRLSSFCGSRTSSGFHHEINARVTVDTPIGEPHFLPGLHNPEGLLRAIGPWLHLGPSAPAWGLATGISHGDAQDHRV